MSEVDDMLLFGRPQRNLKGDASSGKIIKWLERVAKIKLAFDKVSWSTRESGRS
jgi:hypothetical protein